MTVRPTRGLTALFLLAFLSVGASRDSRCAQHSGTLLDQIGRLAAVLVYLVFQVVGARDASKRSLRY